MGCRSPTCYTIVVMTETLSPATEPRTLEDTTSKPRRRVKPTDLLIIAGFIVVVVLLVIFLIHKLQLKRDVASATVVTNQVIDDLSKRDGVAARNLGNTKFKSTYTAATLTQQFKAIELVTGEKPTIDAQAASSGKSGKTVLVVYKYPKKLANQPFFVGIAVTQAKGSHSWQLTNISGSADESKIGF
jgi:hypothetical protein